MREHGEVCDVLEAEVSDSVSVEAEDEAKERLEKVLFGHLDNLPPLSSRIVRIFTSSTFTDTTLERNCLMEKVYPQLKEFCRERHGLEFQVVDMRWGVRDEATDDHMTTHLCMQEIDNCQRLSVGPNFVVFLGQKYGYRPIPTHILASEFEMLRECARNVQSELNLLDEWYRRDNNSVPPVYVIQPISSILTNFNNKRSQRLQEIDQAQWWETFSKLQRIIRKSAQVLFITKKIDREQMHNYFMSVTEREIVRGCLKAPDPEDHCLAYIRDISNINVTLLRLAGKFVDFAARNLDGEAQKFLKSLRDDKIPKRLPPSNVARFTVEWSGKDGIDPESHGEYFNQFCEHFYNNVVRLIDNAMAKHEKLASDPVYSEPLQHLHSCQQFCKVFQGREEVVEKIKDYILGKNASHQPFVLYGESGCGKTSLMAKGASQVRTWFKTTRNIEPVVILRFLGTTPRSSSIIPLLTSLCKQLSTVYLQDLDEIPSDLAPLTQHFKKLLSFVTEDKPLVIFLDSLDQLSGSEGAHQLTWIPTTLPEHARLILSTLPNYFDLLQTLKVLIEDTANYVEVLPLGENLSSTILKLWLNDAKRNVSEEQWTVVNDAISRCNLPLFVKLVFDEICKWKSYTMPNMTKLSFTINDSIMELFKRIESRHGKTLVSHALGFITATKSGVSEAELEDLLSLDDKVLNDVYQYHLPPVRRIPPLLWTRIRNDLPGYLSEKEADGVNVIGWYHRQFIDAARERYFKNLNFVRDMHSNLADYFLGTWGGGVPKPFEYTELHRQRFGLSEKKGEGDRKVPAQPLKFVDKDGRVFRHNLRKLSELPYHLLRSHRHDELYDQVLFNYKWLHAKLSSMPLQSVLADFEDLLQSKYDNDVKLIADTIRLSSSILSHHPDMLGPQIIGRLLPFYGHNPKIQALIEQCDTHGLADCALVPAYHCLHTPSGPLQYSLEGHPFAPFGIGTTSDGKYLVSVSNKIIIWDFHTGEIIRNITPGIGGIMQNLHISPNDKYSVSNTNNNQVVICAIKTGDFKVITANYLDKQETILGSYLSNTHIAMCTDRAWYLYTIDGTFISRQESELNMPVIFVNLSTGDSNFVVVNSGKDDNNEMALESDDGSFAAFEFHSAIAVSKDRATLYACIEISDNAVVLYRREEKAWKYSKTISENTDNIFAMALSLDERYLIATVAMGFKLWDLRSSTRRDLKLPPGARNIPTRNQLTSPVVFTKANEFVVSTVRKNIYVWDVKQGNLVKILDAHFGRIIAISAVSASCNIIISASIDKTIKVWNFDKILEDVHPIDRLEKPIETLDMASNTDLCVSTTRNMVAVWNLLTGRLEKTFTSNARGSVITNAVITKDGKYVISIESGNAVLWELSQDTALTSLPIGDVQHILLYDGDSRVLALSKSPTGKGLCVCFSIPDTEFIFKFEYNVKNFRAPILTKDELNLAVPAMDKSGDVIGVYHAKVGTLMYNLQLKYNNYKDYTHLVSLPHDSQFIAVIDSEKANILDLKKKTLVRSVYKWNGVATSNGKTGFDAPSRGGLQLIDTKSGKNVRTLIPRVAEGVFSIDVMFTKNDKHILYYHSGHKTIRVFRISDGKKIATFKPQAEVKVMVGNDDGTKIAIGTVDGSVTYLALADPDDEGSGELIKSLPSRQVHAKSNTSLKFNANGEVINSKIAMGTALQVARFVAKARGAQKSQACVIS
ncbi:NACHT and WD repeat domain-containing protein 2 [Patella vulgata]|uniref:NACHT and WD repeat domain-containing protein 2 n=1 Tax=Patella vulgata TaxID=6465 RepID=UPI00217FBACF|nr:NACHT and WD repeat domain-containing protein 2 [Patella vulgata]